MINKILLSLILLLALFLRTKDLDAFSPGVYLDEASMAYDAYSFGLMGTDQYGKSLPIYLRSFAMYQSPLYTYLSIVPIKLLGVNPIGIRLLSVVAGMITIIVVYFLMKLTIPTYGQRLGLVSAFVLAISPWHILFSRNALEANLALCIFITSIYLLFYGIYKNSKVAIFFGLITLAITNYAYHSYRFTSIVTALVFPVFFWNKMNFSVKRIYTVGLIFFCLILIPQVAILNTPGSLRRIQLLDYTSEKYFNTNGGEFREIPLGRYFFIGRAFLGKYFDYLSPKSIFFDSDPAQTKSIIELSSFYSWMVVFYLLGIILILRKYYNRVFIFFIFVGLISLIPAAITTDNLYLLRVLSYLLVVAIIVSLGLMELISLINNRFIISLLLLTLLIISLLNFDINYFHISKHERKGDYSGLFNELFEYTKLHPYSTFVVNITEPNVYGIVLYVYKYDPVKYQQNLNFDLNNYYGDIPVPKTFDIANIKIREIDWGNDIYVNQYLVGDELSIPEHKAADNNLTFVEKFTADLDRHHIVIYKTNPKNVCLKLLNQNKTINLIDNKCKIIIEN